jgi:hypothetical protein
MIPTRSQIEAYTTDHLVDAADHWDGLADTWEDAHWQVRNEAHALDWQGVAGDALRARTASDYTVASDHADQLRATSRIARQQAGELERLRNRVLYAVEDAHNAGFTVGEDLSVTDTRTSRTSAELAARQAQAQVFAADIRSRAGALVGADTEAASNLTTASAGVGNPTFAHRPGSHTGGDTQEMGFGDDPDAKHHGRVQTADGKHDGHIQQVDNIVGGNPELPRHDPPYAKWDGHPPPGWHPGTGYWALDTDHPSNSRNPLPPPSLYQSDPQCVRPDLLTGPPTGVTPVGGGSDNPQGYKAEGFDLQGTSRVRVVGSEFNGITQMVQVDGRWYQAQWQEYQYQINTIPVWQGTNDLGGITLPDMSYAHTWQPVSLGQLMQASTVYPEATFYLPDLSGGSIKIQNGWWVGGVPSTGIPTPPVMTRGN